MPKADADTSETNRQDTETTWRDTRPWLLLLRTFRTSVGLQILLLATLGAVTTSAGWRLAGTWTEGIEGDKQYLSKWPGERREPGLPTDGRISSVLAHASG